MKKIGIFLFTALFKFTYCSAQPAPKPYGAIPSARQLKWQETDMYCIIHFSMATFTDKEWGYGDEDLKTFDPKNFNAYAILSAAKAGGINGVVVVAKHHDGFCLWPTKTTLHNIANSPYKAGHGDIVKEYELASRKLGMKMGIYCSPWDRNNPLYGKPDYVTNVYRKQLRELYANYGTLFMSWHDGANGGDGYYGGTREVRKIDKGTYYGWKDTWAITRAMQPGAAIFGDAGPDVRWVGNEEGQAGETCWETFTPHAVEGTIPSNGNVKYWEAVEGTRNGNYWMPAECDVPLRPGWFYHRSQDGHSKTPYQLVDLYYKSVGRSACLDLGLSPDKSGRLTGEDIASLKGFGNIIKKTFSKNIAIEARFYASNIRGNNQVKFGTHNLTDNDRYSYWATADNVHDAQLGLKFKKPVTFNVIRLRENIKLGQRIDSVSVSALINGRWQKIAIATSIGACRLLRLPQNITTDNLKLYVYAPVGIALSDLGLFKEPTHLTSLQVKRNIDGTVSISTEAPVESIRYTTDGSEPTYASKIYSKPFDLPNGGTIKAIAFEDRHTHSDIATNIFGISKRSWKLLNNAPSKNEQDAKMAFDDNAETIWTSTNEHMAGFPQEISIDMGKDEQISAFTFLPRQDKKSDGMPDHYRFSTSNDGVNWSTAASGEFSNISANPVEQLIPLRNKINARYFKFTVTHVIKGNGITIAELGVRN